MLATADSVSLIVLGGGGGGDTAGLDVITVNSSSPGPSQDWRLVVAHCSPPAETLDCSEWSPPL